MGKVLRFGRIVGFPYLTLTKSKLAPNLWIVIPFVASLIDPLTRNWNFDLLQEVFQHEEALVISNIYLCPLQLPDR
jgi:hypothetical protein